MVIATKLTGDIWNRMTPIEREQLGVKAKLDAETRGGRWLDLFPAEKRALIREFKKEQALPTLEAGKSAPVTTGVKRYVIREEPEPLYKSGKKYTAYYETGEPRYLAAETPEALQKRLLEAEPTAQFISLPTPKAGIPEAKPKAEKGKVPVTLSWDDIHLQSREDIALKAGFQKSVAKKKWGELETWEQKLLEDSLEKRSKGETKLALPVKSALPGIKATKDLPYKDYAGLKQTPRGRAADLSQKHSIVIESTSPRIKAWLKNPGSMDVRGIDTPKIGRRPSAPKKTKKSKPKSSSIRVGKQYYTKVGRAVAVSRLPLKRGR